jgi:hypothetical protein
MANTSINLTSLDYETLKEEFRTFMKSQTKFRDFDFDGSNINELFKVMALNTHKNAFYLNMVASESFVDTAQLAASIRSHAKELNYCPRSARSAKATINMSFRTDPNIAGSETVIIPKGTAFTAVSNFRTYVFTVPTTVTMSSSNNTFSFEDLEIYEGNYVTDSYVMDYTSETQRFVITNDMVDTSSLTVTVIEDDGQSVLSYLPKTTLLDLTSSSKVYFLQTGPKETYEIVFGDNVLGRRPKDGAVIVMEYRVSAGTDPNGANKFAVSTDFAGGTIVGNITIETVSKAQDGTFPEDIESIRYYAPRHFQVQERAVTTNDYEIILKEQFPEIGAVSVYGGEEVSPPRFGKVFVALDIINVDGLPDSKKSEYYSYLKSRCPLSIDPIFIEPEYLYYSIYSAIKYNINLTTIKPDDIKALVRNVITEYNEQYLNDFKSTLRFSKFIAEIDQAHESIVSNETTIQLYKKINPTLGEFENFNISFDLPLYISEEDGVHSTHEIRAIHTIKSSFFILDGALVYFEDDGNGSIYIVNQVSSGRHQKIKKIGTVNYETGKVTISNFKCDSYIGSALKVYAKPRSKDVFSNKNQILTVEDDEIRIDVEKVRE